MDWKQGEVLLQYSYGTYDVRELVHWSYYENTWETKARFKTRKEAEEYIAKNYPDLELHICYGQREYHFKNRDTLLQPIFEGYFMYRNEVDSEFHDPER